MHSQPQDGQIKPPYCIVMYLPISIAWAFHKSSRLQQLTLCGSLHAEALQAAASEGLAQGPYEAARMEFKPVTLQSKDIDSTNAPPSGGALVFLSKP